MVLHLMVWESKSLPSLLCKLFLFSDSFSYIPNNIMKQLLYITSLSFLLLILTACIGSKTLVLEPLTSDSNTRSITIKAFADTERDHPQRSKRFTTILEEQIYFGTRFSKGSDITLEYRFLELDPGSRYGKWVGCGLLNLGEGRLKVEVVFIDNRSHKIIGKIHTEENMKAGVYGGSFEDVLKHAAIDIAKYAKLSMRN